MSVEAVVHRLVCDDCRAAWISPVAATPRAAREVARLAGWTIVGGDRRDQEAGDRCPRCTRRAAVEQVTDAAAVGGAAP